MDDSDTETFELTRGEAREVINALSDYQVEASGSDEERALNVREFLQREFGFEDRQFESDSGLADTLGGVFGTDDSEHEVQLSRVEAAEMVPALADLEADSEPAEAETIADLRSRFEDAFNLDADRTR